MVERAYTSEQIIDKLRIAEVLLSQGSTVAEVGTENYDPYVWIMFCNCPAEFKTF